MKIRAFDIKWDTDGEDIPLPEEFIFELEDHEDIEEFMSDTLSEITGFCHQGFDYEVLD